MAKQGNSGIALQLQILAAIAMAPLPFFYFPEITPFSGQQIRDFLYDFCWTGGWELANGILPWSVEEPESLFDSVHVHYYLVLPVCGTMIFFLKLCVIALLGNVLLSSLKSLRDRWWPVK